MRAPANVLTTLVLATTAVLGVGAAATAADPVTVTATDVTYTQLGTYTGSVDVGGLDATQSYDVVVSGPDGSALTTERTTAGATTYHAAPSLAVGTNAAGTYAVSVSTVATDTVPASVVASGSFKVIEPVLTLSRYSRREMDVRLTLDGAPLANRRVYVLRYYNHAWHNEGYLHTTRRGWAGIYCKKHHRCPSPFAFTYRDFVASDTFRLYTGRKNGRYAEAPRAAHIAVG